MFERFKRQGGRNDYRDDRPAATAGRERVLHRNDDRETVERDRDGGATAVRDRDYADRPRSAATGLATREAVRDARLRQRDEFGGFNWGAAFFGWLVAVGLAAILTGILSAAGAAIGLTEVSESEASDNAETIGIVGGAILVGILMLAYYAGGYVAGRMSRFDGARQGFGVWVFGLLVAIAPRTARAIAGAEYNVLEKLELPRIPIDEGSLTTGGVIALVAVVLGTLIAALAGGKVGERYHRRVDRAAVVD
jgi:hypothetical protein